MAMFRLKENVQKKNTRKVISCRRDLVDVDYYSTLPFSRTSKCVVEEEF